MKSFDPTDAAPTSPPRTASIDKDHLQDQLEEELQELQREKFSKDAKRGKSISLPIIREASKEPTAGNASDEFPAAESPHEFDIDEEVIGGGLPVFDWKLGKAGSKKITVNHKKYRFTGKKIASKLSKSSKEKRMKRLTFFQR